MAPIFAIIRYALLETFFCIPILPKTNLLLIFDKFAIVVSFLLPKIKNVLKFYF